MRKPRILIAGNTTMDLVSSVEAIPGSGNTCFSGGSYYLSPGGKGACLAVACARLGAEAIFCTKLGGDNYGKQLIDTFKSENIDCRFVFIDSEEKTGFTQTINEFGGSSRTIIFPGANKKLSLENLEESFTSYPDALLIQCEAEPSAIKYAMVSANRQDIPIFFDLSHKKDGLEGVFKADCEIVFALEDQAEYYTGVFPGNTDSCLRAAISLYKSIKTKFVVINLKDRGCYIYDGIHQELIQPLDVRAADYSGSDDAFVSALVTRYMQNGADISDAARFANCVRAYSVITPGTFDSLPTLEQLESFINNYIER